MSSEKPAASISGEKAEAKLNPLEMSFDKISHDVIGIHDSTAKRQDVDYLYLVVSNIVKNSTHLVDFLNPKRFKTVDIIEDKVPETTFMPSFSTLREIGCQMTCKSFKASTAHETVTGILGMLKSYTWDAKAVAALAAFALDYGESWQLSLMQATNQNAPELHLFRLGGFEKDKSTQPNDQLKPLVELTLQLIQKIMDLEKEIAEDSTILKEVAALSAAKREVYTYWAIFALACASQTTQLEWNIKSEVLPKLNAVIPELGDFLQQIKKHKDEKKRYKWAVSALHSPSGILALLKALIFLKDVEKLDFFDNSTKKMANLDVIKQQYLLLFISGLDNIQKEIRELKSIADEIKKDKSKQQYRILWIPVVENWTDDKIKRQFENIKSEVPWYVVHHFQPCEGLQLLQDEFHYYGKPIVVVTDPRGRIIHKNAMHMIFGWGINAFPFGPDDEKRLSEQWNWFWFGASKVHSDIANWVKDENYVFLYGAADNSSGQSLAELIDTMEEDLVIKDSGTSIKHFDFGKAKKTDISEFWDIINHSFYNTYAVTKDIAWILSKKEEKEWVLVSKGQNVFLIDSNISLMREVLQKFEDWKVHVKNKGFKEAFMECYEIHKPRDFAQCCRLKVVDIHSGIPMGVTCPDCSQLKMEIESVSYKCCHGKHNSATTTEAPAKPNVEGINKSL